MSAFRILYEIAQIYVLYNYINLFTNTHLLSIKETLHIDYHDEKNHFGIYFIKFLSRDNIVCYRNPL